MRLRCVQEGMCVVRVKYVFILEAGCQSGLALSFTEKELFFIVVVVITRSFII